MQEQERGILVTGNQPTQAELDKVVNDLMSRWNEEDRQAESEPSDYAMDDEVIAGRTRLTKTVVTKAERRAKRMIQKAARKRNRQ